MKYYLVSYMSFGRNGSNFGAGHAWVSTNTVFDFKKFEKDLNSSDSISLMNVQEVSKEMWRENI